MADAVKVGAAALRAMLLDGGELALIDVREERVFSESHLLFARSVPSMRRGIKLFVGVGFGHHNSQRLVAPKCTP